MAPACSLLVRASDNLSHLTCGVWWPTTRCHIPPLEVMDAATADGGLVDAATADGGLVNAATADGGLVNAATADGGLADAATADGGLADAATADGGLVGAATADGVWDWSGGAGLAECRIDVVGRGLRGGSRTQRHQPASGYRQHADGGSCPEPGG
jgi:hypothetical protein